VRTEGLYHVDLVLCNPDISSRLNEEENGQFQLSSRDSSAVNEESINFTDYFAKIEGQIDFHNPYGYLPAEINGILPFEAVRVVLYLLTLTWYLSIYSYYKESLLHIHSALLTVFVLAMVEATSWFATYLALNLTGERFCCPYPPLVIVSLLLQLIRQTLARSLLLVVSLGYGIVRPRLLLQEWIAIFVVTLFYFFAAAAQQINVIVLGSIVRHHHKSGGSSSSLSGANSSSSSGSQLMTLPEFIMDTIFLTWIYFAITSTIRILAQFKQTEKLKIYENLVSIIVGFVLVFAIVAMFFVLGLSLTNSLYLIGH
jgi:hypothetical protein